MALDQIGQKLKAARESQGLTLIQIYERTKIPLHHLQSIDTGTTDDLPEAVYVAGFIKRYAEVVGLNGQALSEEYRREAAEEHSGNGNGGFLPRPAKLSSSPVVVVPAPYMGKTRIESGQPSIMRMLFFPAISVIMLIGLLAVLLQWHSNSTANQPDSSILSLKDATAKYNQVQPTTTVPPVSGGPTQPGVPGQPATPPTPQDSTFSVIASRHVWVEITAMSTGQTEYTGFLERGDRRDYKDPQGIRIHTGSAGSLTIDSNGKSEVLGLPGKPADRVFLAKGVTSATPGAVAPGMPGATGPGSILGAPGTTPGTKPLVKRPVKKPTDGSATKAHRYRSIDEAPSRQYMPGESLGGHKSIDVPYRYTEGRLDQE
jgi:cytoskeletal protein RodZ